MKLNSYIHNNIMTDLDKSTPMSSNTEEKIQLTSNALDTNEGDSLSNEVDSDEESMDVNEIDEAEEVDGDGDEVDGDGDEVDAEDAEEIDIDDEEDENDEDDDENDEDDDEDDEDMDTEALDDMEDDENMNNSKSIKAKKSKKKIITTEVETVLGTSISGPDNIETAAEDYDSDDDDYEAEDFQKLDDEMRKNYVLMNHPESINQNYEEIYKLSKTVRNKNNVIVDAAHRTIPMLTKYEKARILGIRAKQINNGAAPFIELKENIIDGYLIAERELAEKKLPFIIRRPLPNRGSEYWRLEDLEIL